LTRTTLTAVLACIVFVLMYAAATEFLQRLIPTRSATFLDFGADALGMGLGVIVWIRICRRFAGDKFRPQ